MGLQKYIDSTEFKTGQGSGTLDEDTTRATFEASPSQRPGSKWDNSGMSWRR